MKLVGVGVVRSVGKAALVAVVVEGAAVVLAVNVVFVA